MTNRIKNLSLVLLNTILLCGLAGQPLLAQQGKADGNDDQGQGRPPAGYARPPFHTKGNAASGPTGITPAQVRLAYGFNNIANQGEGQTIAIVDAYDHPNIESDLGVFSSKFGLPTCTTTNGCFKKIYASGRRPQSNAGWALEIALDVEWAHAIAPKAKIVLVEAASNRFGDLMQAVDAAVNPALGNARVVSMSWGGNEFSSQWTYDNHFTVPGVVFTASSGDNGNGVEYPAASPYVVAVGGTTLSVDASGNYLGETAWAGSGGGISSVASEPSYQSSAQSSGQRGVPDVAYDGDPNTGFPVYDSVRYSGQTGWFQVGGTSAGAPQWAALIAIANSLRGGLGKATIGGGHSLLYNAPADNFHDITSGTNGSCGAVCTASSHYDFVTGLGSPKADLVINTLKLAQ
jgi:subtilase family serine protease